MHFYFDGSHFANALIFVFILIGVSLHAQRLAHVRIMITCAIADLALLLYVELRDQAVEDLFEKMAVIPWILWIHVAVSATLLFLWPACIVSGSKIYRGKVTDTGTHKKLAMTFLVFRFLTLATSTLIKHAV
ncbi:MAG: hypothetical protein NUW37_17655 [Planctomycetes bacterium]|nr:hypothetical protein [Planctomycetota bacterium]